MKALILISIFLSFNLLAGDGAGGIAGGSGTKKSRREIELLTPYQKVAYGIKGIEEASGNFSIYDTFEFKSRRLKQIISWPESYERNDGLYTTTQQELIEFRNHFIDKYRHNPVIKTDPVLRSIVNYGDELMEISLRDYTYKNLHDTHVLDLVGKDKIDYRKAAQTALTLYLFCNWNEEHCGID
jgi:hypothetical protein